MRTETWDNLVRNGLPAWVYTWRTVVLLFLFGPFAMMILLAPVQWIWSTVVGPSHHAPTCYTMNLAGPAAAGHKPFRLDEDPVVKIVEQRERVSRTVTAAINSCQPGACVGAERKNYRDAVLGYLGGRGQAAQTLFLRSGDAGLAYAEELYATPDDDAIVEAIKQGFAAGLLDIERLHSHDEIVRMVLFRPRSEVKLCQLPPDHTCPYGRATC